MTKVSSLPQTVWHWFANQAISPVRHSIFTDLTAKLIHQLKKLGNRCGRMVKRQGLWLWVLALTGASLLMVWNGVLLISLSIGLATTVLIQQLQRQQISLQTVSKLFSEPYTPPLLAVGGGLLSLIASYMTLLIWQDTNSLGLSLALLLLELGVLSLLGLFLWQILKQDKPELNSTQLDYWINNLTALDPLKRLIAIRQINRFVASTRSDRVRTQEIKEYFQLLLEQESEPIIQNAIAEGLKITPQ